MTNVNIGFRKAISAKTNQLLKSLAQKILQVVAEGG